MRENGTSVLISDCRACGSTNLEGILDLGVQPLSGVFPKKGDPDPLSGPLSLIICRKCALVQLAHNYPLSLMYGENYGYRSGLNESMASHLQLKAQKLSNLIGIKPGEIVLDIGSNDGTFLNSFNSNVVRVGFDPTIIKFGEFYDDSIIKKPEFFSAKSYLASFTKAKLITSISMFYDLQKPLDFVQDIKKCLAKDGFWHFEQSYLYSMLQSTSYDTICHEHLEYYSMESVINLLDLAGLKIIDVELNNVNGGSFSLTATHHENPVNPSPLVSWMKNYESYLETISPLSAFDNKVKNHKKQLTNLLGSLSHEGFSIWGLGASTKGNVLLNYCEIDSSLVTKIADVNPYKSGRSTPGSRIDIVPEDQFLSERPDYALVLPWHFRSHLTEKYANYLGSGGKLIYPFPSIEIVSD